MWAVVRAHPLELRFARLGEARLAGCLAYRIRHTVFGQARNLLVPFNENLLKDQPWGIQASNQNARCAFGHRW